MVGTFAKAIGMVPAIPKPNRNIGIQDGRHYDRFEMVGYLDLESLKYLTIHHPNNFSIGAPTVVCEL